MRAGIAGLLTGRGAPVERSDLDQLSSWLALRGARSSVHVTRPDERVGLVQRADDDADVGAVVFEGSGCLAVCDGHLHNVEELRRKLRARGHPLQVDDTPNRVLAAGYREWGAELPELLDGTFALCCVDLDERRLLLARDRLGLKPLFVAGPAFFAGESTPRVAFASELRALACLPQAKRELSATGAARFLALHHVPEPSTLWEHALQLPAGGLLEIALDDERDVPSRGRLRRYWEPGFAALADARLSARRIALRDALDDAAAAAVEGHDEVGVLLTGGLDSSLVAALATRHAPAVHTFGLAFRNPLLDESVHARRVARHLGTTHHEQVVSADGLRDSLPYVVAALDQPAVDPAAVTTLLVARLAKRHVSLALTGDGGDEAFLGHPGFVAERLRPRLLDRAPAGLRRSLGVLDPWVEPRAVVRQHARVTGVRRATVEKLLAGDLARSAFEPLERLEADAERLGARDTWDVLGFGALRASVAARVTPRLDLVASHADLALRAPLLDRRVVDVGLALRGREKLRGLVTKVPLREAARGLLPDRTVERPTRHATPPVSSWLTRALRPLVEEVVLEGPALQTGVFDAAACRTLLADHLAGRPGRAGAVLALFFFAMWLGHYQDHPERNAA
jgi:asparagine synthase (glutamine-hydrolysing)